MVHCILQLKSTFETYIRYLFRQFFFFVVVVVVFFVPFVPHILFKMQ